MKAATPDTQTETRTQAGESPFAVRVARVRHDLQNPIGHILGFGEMLLEEIQEPPHLRTDLELIVHTAGQMVAHIRECLDVRKIEGGLAGVAPLQRHLAEAASQIEAAVERLTPAISGADAEKFKSDLARIAGAAQVMREVAGTSLKRLSRTTETHGFQTEFLKNPLAAALRLGSDTQPILTAQREGEILVVDDLEENRELLQRRLSRLGYSVQLTDSGARALEIVAAKPVDVILLDIMMPGLNGFEVLQQLKANPTTQHIPVLMLSSADELATVVRCIQLGAEDFLPKPFNTTLLMARIESSLSRKRLRDQETAFLKRLQAEQETSERLLLNILPKPVAERLKQGERTIADSFPEATVLFSDFVDFTKYSTGVSPKDLVGRLNEIFSAFDQLCERHGLEKIKMIGDAYMVVGGLPTPRADHAEAMADLALAMQAEVARFTSGNNAPFRMRVGINTGPVVAGVIGTKKFAYDLWGDTVNLASRMETHAPPGGILVTPATYKRLRKQYRFKPGRVIRVKGKGRMVSHLLLGKA